MPNIAKSSRVPCLALLALIGGILWATPAHALINKEFTPADFVKGSKDVALLSAPAPRDGVITAKLEESIKGGKLPDSLVIEASDLIDETAQLLKETFGESPALPAVILTSRLPGDAAASKPDAMLLIGTHFFALYGNAGKYRLDKDPIDRDAVWAGGARSLARAAKILVQNPRLDFPVAATMRWGGEIKLGHLAGKANAALPIDFRGKLGRCVLVLAADGDRVYHAAPAGGKPSDITAATKLVTKSRLAAAGDFSGDGRLDLVTWDGKSLAIARQAADGTFAAQPIDIKLADCASLSCIDVGHPKRAGLLAGTSAGPVLVLPDDKSAWTTQVLVAAPDDIRALGPGGFCVVADFHHSGLPEIIQLFTKGYLTFSADKPGHYGAGVRREMALVDTPAAAIAGDFDGDGELDLIVSGGDGSVLLCGGAPQSLTNRTVESGELAYHGNKNSPAVVASSLFDINNDGRPGFELLYAARGPMGFFNRGYGCFGLGREVSLLDSKLESAPSLQEGVQAGAIADLSGDGIPDLLAIDGKGDVWLLLGEAAKERGPLTLDVTLPAGAAGPVTFTVTGERRSPAMYVLRAGENIQIGSRAPTDLSLQWLDASGQKRTRQVSLKESQRIELSAQ